MQQRRRRSESGAVLVEAACCLVVCLILVGGIMDYGGLFGNTVGTAASVREATRVGTETTTEVSDDSEIVDAVLHAPGATRADIQRIVIYKADSLSAQAPSACLGSSSIPAGTLCNVYLPADFSLSKTELQARDASGNWPSSARVAGVDDLGVAVIAKNAAIMKIVWSPSQFNDHYVMRIQPYVLSGSGGPVTSPSWTSGTDVKPPFNWDDLEWDGGPDEGGEDGGPSGEGGGSA